MFDIDAWLDEAAPPQRSVTVYGRGDLVAQLQDLADTETLPGDVRLGGDPRQAEIDALRNQIEASALTVHVRGLLDQEQQQALDASTTGEGPDRKVDDFAYDLALFALAAVEPTFTSAQSERLRAAIGQAQWDALFTGISAASKETIDIPLSRLGSGTAQDS